MTTHTVIEFGCWYCRLSAWVLHRLGRCHSFCAHCITEADEYLAQHTPRCEHGEGLTDYCEPCGRVNGGH